MKRKTRKNNINKIIVFVLALSALVVVGLVVYFVFIQDSPSAKDNSQPDKAVVVGQDDDEQIRDGENSSASDSSSLPVVESDKDVQHDTPSAGDELGVWTTIASVSGDTLLIRIQIDQNIGSGTCELKIGDYTETVPVAAQPQSASCDGFDVPTSAYSGDEFRVLVRSGDKSGVVEGKING